MSSEKTDIKAKSKVEKLPKPEKKKHGRPRTVAALMNSTNYYEDTLRLRKYNTSKNRLIRYHTIDEIEKLYKEVMDQLKNKENVKQSEEVSE